MTAAFPHGLVVGKFYPPHRGHLHVIETAAAQCGQVTVLVMAARQETVPLGDRVAWLRAACGGLPAVTVIGVPCDVPVDFASAPVWSAQVAVMRAALEGNGRQSVGAVFSSEAGAPLIVCDTDAFATSVWERRYLGARARGLQPWATTGLPRHDVYLVTSHEGVPWNDDGLREGDLAIRAAMTRWFTAALTAAGHSWVLLTGSIDDRLALAVRVTDAVLADQARFGPAITGDVPAGGSTAR